MRHRSLVLGTVVLSFLAFACKRELSRDEAKKLLSAAFPAEDVTHLVPAPATNWSCENEAGKLRQLVAADWQPLIENGLMAYTLTGNRRPSRPNGYTCDDGFLYEIKFDFTNEGRKYFLGPSSSVELSRVRLCTARLGQVTGITPPDASGLSRIEFTIDHADLTPFAQVWQRECGSGPIQRLTAARRYDDGWRLVQQ